MKLNEVIDLSNQLVKHAEQKLPNQYKNENWGKRKKLKTRDVIVRDTNTGTIYGRRTVVDK